MENLNLKTAKELDAVLQKLVEFNRANGTKHLSLFDAKKQFPEIIDLDFIFDYLKDFEFQGNPIIQFSRTKISKEIYITGYTNIFVENGGFIKIFEDSKTKRSKQELKEDLEIKLSKSQIENLKRIPRQVLFTQIATGLSILLAIISIIISLKYK